MATGADVVIAGASFAGLAVARALKGREVLLLDPHPVGAFVKSACALPGDLAERFGAEAVLEQHEALVFHFSQRTLRLPTRLPYVTIDYRRFCERLLAESGVTLLQARALKPVPGGVLTSAGKVSCRLVVDATGPSAVLASSLTPGYAEGRFMGAGLEVELPRPPGFPSGLHFYLNRELPPGYGWAFGAGETLRVGVGVFDSKRSGRDLGGVLARLLGRLGLEPEPEHAHKHPHKHGGLIPLKLRAPVVGELFVVGDAAGQVLPVTAEGIRPALAFGHDLGGLLARVLKGELSPAAARHRYRQRVAARRGGYRALGSFQDFVSATPHGVGLAALYLLARWGRHTPSYPRYLRGLRPADTS